MQPSRAPPETPPRQRYCTSAVGSHRRRGAMALYGREAGANRGENLLGLVRDRGVVMPEPMLDGLLEAVDSLKGLRDAAVESRADTAASAALLQKLDALFEAAGGTEAAPVELPQAAAGSAGSAELNEDGEMLDLFIELLQTRLPELARAFHAHQAPRHDPLHT